MKQKTVRFYDDAPEDVSALRILDECRKYGFNSAREMVIAAINRYAQGNGSLGISSRDIDELADKIAIRMKKMNVTISKEDGLMEEKDNDDGTDQNEENYQKAFSFLETL